MMNCDPGPGLPVEAAALLGTSADIDVNDVPFLDLSSVRLTQELPSVNPSSCTCGKS